MKWLEQRREIANQTGDPLEVAGDLRLIARFHLEQGRAREAAELFGEAAELSESADVSHKVRERQRRTRLSREAIIAVALGDLGLAREKANEYVRKISLFEGPTELRRAFAMEGEINLSAKDFPAALSSLAQADQSDPRILWLQAIASQQSGDNVAARQFAERIVNFNEPVYGYALYRDRAKDLLR